MMDSSRCNRVAAELDDWIDGSRSAGFVEHLAGCGRCRGAVADLKAIHDAAAVMRTEQMDPPPYLWRSLKAQLEREGIVRLPRRTWRQALPGHFTRPALSFAYSFALLFGIGLLSSQVNHSERATWQQQPETASAIYDAKLQTMEGQTAKSWSDPDPEVASALRSDLAMVDNYIFLCKKSVSEQPDNELARDYLNNAYQQKSDLLASMVERGVSLQ
jgi:hypothetical protein